MQAFNARGAGYVAAWRGAAGAIAAALLVAACTEEFKTTVGPCEATGAPVCSNNQTCVASAGSARCECKAGFSGATCSKECAAGQQDNDSDGTCKPGCGDAGATATACGLHTICDDSKGALNCSCAPGYTASAGGSPPSAVCKWTGVIKDPGFQGTPAGAWQLERAILEPTAPADLNSDTGRVLIDRAPLLLQDAQPPPLTSPPPATVSQTFVMPTIAQGQAYSLRANASASGDAGPIGGGASFLTVKTGVRSWTQTYLRSRFGEPTEFCLGARWYGRAVGLTLAFSAESRFRPFEPPGSIMLDRADIQPSSKCIVPGTLLNGDFESTGGWVPDVSAQATAGGALAKIDVAGNMFGQKAGLLAIRTVCDSVSLTNQISPLEGPSNAALSFKYSGTPLSFARVQLGGLPLAQLTGSGVPQSVTICLPEGAKGAANTLSFVLSGPGGTCAQALVRDWRFDDVELKTDPSCVAPHLIANPAFEAEVPYANTWISSIEGSSWTTGPGETGKGASIPVSETCGGRSLQSMVSIPMFGGGANTIGYALRFRARGRGTLTYASASVQVGGHSGRIASTTSFKPEAEWLDQKLCVGPALADNIAQLTVYAYNGAAPNTACYLPANFVLDVDNFRFEPDATCPSK